MANAHRAQTGTGRPLLYYLHLSAGQTNVASRRIMNVAAEQEIAILRQILHIPVEFRLKVATFQHKILWVLKISILLLNYGTPKWRFLTSNCAFLDQIFPTTRFFRQFSNIQKCTGDNYSLPFATTPLNSNYVTIHIQR